jgi:hypothetical protein
LVAVLPVKVITVPLFQVRPVIATLLVQAVVSTGANEPAPHQGTNSVPTSTATQVVPAQVASTKHSPGDAAGPT